MDQLEAEAAGLRRELQVMQTELSGARSDNVQLYEKIRYLQSYQAKQAGAADSAYHIVQVDGDGIPQAKVGGSLGHGECHFTNAAPHHLVFWWVSLVQVWTAALRAPASSISVQSWALTRLLREDSCPGVTSAPASMWAPAHQLWGVP